MNNPRSEDGFVLEKMRTPFGPLDRVGHVSLSTENEMSIPIESPDKPFPQGFRGHHTVRRRGRLGRSDEAGESTAELHME